MEPANLISWHPCQGSTSFPGRCGDLGWQEMTLTCKAPQTPAHTMGQTEQLKTNSYHWYLLVSYPVLHFNPTISAFLLHLDFSNFLFRKENSYCGPLSPSAADHHEKLRKKPIPRDTPSQLSRGAGWLQRDRASSGSVWALGRLSQGRSTISWKRDL